MTNGVVMKFFPINSSIKAVKSKRPLHDEIKQILIIRRRIHNEKQTKMTYELNSGTELPKIGLGTFKIRGKELIYQTLDTALATGYRLIDTAAVYRNETDIGEALQELLPKYKLNREDIFLTSKLGPKDQGSGNCHRACLESIKNLQTDYLDLYLIHWPGTQGKKPEDQSNIRMRQESWKDMEELYREGKLKAIGVSNYEERHLEDLLNHCTVKPAVLQTEHHPHLVRRNLVNYCRKHEIVFQAYSSLGTSTEDNKLLTDPVVVKMAETYRKTPAQVLLKWALQQNLGVIPKSTNPQHIQDNFDIFSMTLSEACMDKLSNLDTQHHYCWNPESVS